MKVENQLAQESKFTLMTSIYDAKGNSVASTENELKTRPDTVEVYEQRLAVEKPELWGTENPAMYKAVTTLLLDGRVVDKYTTPFGIRSLVFDKDKGFFLNGRNTYVKGVCLHHDGGLVGAAVPKGVWKRRLEKLKEAGCNAIRTSHNPFSEEFLDLSD